jgi:phosphate acetyltransferase
VLDSPVTVDSAITLQAARSKKMASSVAEQADTLPVPNLEAGNGLAKPLR